MDFDICSAKNKKSPARPKSHEAFERWLTVNRQPSTVNRHWQPSTGNRQLTFRRRLKPFGKLRQAHTSLIALTLTAHGDLAFLRFTFTDN